MRNHPIFKNQFTIAQNACGRSIFKISHVDLNILNIGLITSDQMVAKIYQILITLLCTMSFMFTLVYEFIVYFKFNGLFLASYLDLQYTIHKL